MNDNVFVLLEDPLAPTRADCVAAASDPAYAEGEIPPIFVNPTHYRTTFLTLSPPNSLEQLLVQLKARWVPVRQAANNVPARQGTGQQLVIEGLIFTIGTDWLLRVGHVVLAGGALRGMLLEVKVLSHGQVLQITHFSRPSIFLYRRCTHQLMTGHLSCCRIS